LLQEAGIPPWYRNQLPLLYAGEDLVWVPEIGVAADYRATGDEPGLLVSWERNNPAGNP
jgi:tRNA(Ile)-lysidine synthase